MNKCTNCGVTSEEVKCATCNTDMVAVEEAANEATEVAVEATEAAAEQTETTEVPSEEVAAETPTQEDEAAV